MQTIDALSEHLNIEKNQIRTLLTKMQSIGLVKHSLDRWLPIDINLHAEPESLFAKMHHRNWHLNAINSLTTARKDDLFYTAVHTLSESDFFKLRDILLQFIRKSRKIVEPSSDEIGAAFSLSWFRI